MHMVDLTGESFSINDLQCHDEFVMMEKRCIETLLQKVSVWLSTRICIQLNCLHHCLSHTYLFVECLQALVSRPVYCFCLSATY